MGGELGGPGGQSPHFRPQRPRGDLGSGAPPVYKCTAPQRGFGGLAPVWYVRLDV